MGRRIRNGIYLDPPQIGERTARSRPVSPPSAAATEWQGGVQSVTTLTRRAAEDVTTFVVRCDDAETAGGNDTAPHPLGFMAVAISASFVREFIVEAALADLIIDALGVEIELGGDGEPSCTLVLRVSSSAVPSRIESLAMRAIDNSPVLRLLRSPPHIIIAQSGDGSRVEPVTA